MMNIQNKFITTGISVLFGVYSIYNILEYLRVLNNHRVKQINNLQNLINDTNTKYNDLQIKYVTLQKNHNELHVSYEKMNKEIQLLNLKIIELQDNKMIDVEINSVNNSIHDNISVIICDELCDLNSEIPRVHMETMNTIADNTDREFIESLSLEYNCSETDEVSSLCNSEKSSIKSRSRSTSVTEINWTSLTKKFLFG